ncbi:restriction endonuclease subunit S [Acidithiobacillus ferrooxidans]|uniref:Type I restriction-modification system, S subunit n=4 Tax=Acidithiobacillaceae TaxID=225058 RepID=B7J8L6_ACIF2|nr:restriction modification system DNA specificity domain [Acidithiobacillus ferrooxidans ATCC 53993]ACK80477.1 type I restriction-modification system, S subunit [Acidithiobacillus ferrooxidans ATCC 23270]MBN6744620.1 restriction endonuclease subunit S [Acidithiobacillus sp. MC2.2]MBN6747498.1 restriction endonuclease subunit S [Acidithiobacillus sp. PG05]MBU2773802.1 restriction endonuclease subunit S [Acidithiobacillus ferrooxidans]
MANEWKECSLGDVIELKRGYDLPQKERLSGDVPLVSSSGVTDTHAKAMVKGPGVVTGRYGTLGQVFYVRQNFWPLNTTLYVYDFKGNDPRFISYFLREVDFLVYSDKAAVPGLNRNHLHQARVRIPTDPTEQRRIAHILGTLDDKIENNRKTAKTLEAMAQAIFQSWFVDFDPVRAKMAGESPESICKRLKLTPEILDLFPDKLVDSELGEIPEGWVVRSLDNIGNFLNGLALQKFPSKGQDDALPVIKIAQLRSGNLGGADQASCEIEPQYIVHDGDILFSWSGSLECAIWSGGTGALNQHLFKVTPKSDYPRWLCYFGVHHFLDFFREIAAGKATTMGHIQRHHLSDSKLPFPCSGTLDVMNKPLSSMFEVMWMKTVEEQKLVFLRDTLLPKLISGEIRVLDERTIENDRAYPWIK